MRSLAIYFLTLGTLIGLAMAILCNRQIWDVILNREKSKTGISLDTLSYGSLENSDMEEYYEKAMKSRHLGNNKVQIALIDPSEIVLQRIIGEGTFGRVWVAKWRSSQVAVKEVRGSRAELREGPNEPLNPRAPRAAATLTRPPLRIRFRSSSSRRPPCSGRARRRGRLSRRSWGRLGR